MDINHNNKKETKRKTFVLDTNVLIHDPQSLFSFSDNRVVLPMKVIEELDKFKTYKDEKGQSVREVTRKLDQLRKTGKINKGVSLPNGGLLQIITNYLPESQPDYDIGSGEIEEVDLMDTSISDNEIILTALKLQRKHKEKVIFVSKDLNSRIKASALGIESQDYEKLKVVLEDLYTGFVKVIVNTQTINSFYENRKISVNNIENLSMDKLNPNTFIMLEDKLNPSHTGLGRYLKPGGIIVPVYDIRQDVWGIKPLNKEQRLAFDILLDDSILLVTLVGQAGTGKTLLTLAAGLQKTIETKVFSKIVVSRPIVPMGKDIGYLPGTKDEKIQLWMQPIFDNLRFIFNAHHTKKYKDKADSDPDSEINYLRDKNLLELEALTYIRGRTLPKQFLIVDEAQNLTPHEVKTIISRAGEGTKVVLTGDPYQIDNPYLDSNSNGLIYTIDKFKGQEIHAHITLTKSERSSLASLAAELL
jgi:PhoH-like ATPase